ncbi:hypothetical protein A9Q94_17015, partial [Rhodobacterales bacterium 56_14_T64]
MNRSASTISREIRRNGGAKLYRAARSDAAAWARAHRPKPCKLADNIYQRWSQDFGPVVKMDRMTKEMIQND